MYIMLLLYHGYNYFLCDYELIRLYSTFLHQVEKQSSLHIQSSNIIGIYFLKWWFPEGRSLITKLYSNVFVKIMLVCQPRWTGVIYKYCIQFSTITLCLCSWCVYQNTADTNVKYFYVKLVKVVIKYSSYSEIYYGGKIRCN